MKTSGSQGALGFTLIELSIVLVIIGLIVGGTLTGQHLITASRIRAQISQIEKLRLSVNTFYVKYGYFPGDILSNVAGTYGLYHVTGTDANTTGYGDGSGTVDGDFAGAWQMGANFGGETVMFFLHLSQAKMINGFYGIGTHASVYGATTTGGSTSGLPVLNADTTYVGEILPAAAIGDENYVAVGNLNGNNYFVVTGITKLEGVMKAIDSLNRINPTNAYAIDAKADDGLPAKGRVFALDTETNGLGWVANGGDLSTPSANNCVSSSAYNTQNASYARTMSCSLRFSF